MAIDFTSRTIDRLLLNQPWVEDKLVISEQRLGAVVRGEARFTPQEAAELLDSAMTLRRYRVLKRTTLVALPLWEGQGFLLAAGTGSTLQPIDLHCPVGEATLYFEQQPEGTLLSLVVDPGVSTFCHSESAILEVLDGADNRLLVGQPDEDDRVEGLWPLATAPKKWLLSLGKPLRLQARRGKP